MKPEYISLFITILSISLGIYLSTSSKPFLTQIIAWVIAIILILGNTYLYIYKPPDRDIVAPEISSLEALDAAVKSFNNNDNKDYELIDIIGSYYVCLRKPQTIFHIFPEWFFIFRNKSNGNLREVKVSDSRIPKFPSIKLSEEEVQEGWFAYYVVNNDKAWERKGKFDIFDEEGKIRFSIEGTAPLDKISEVIDGNKEKVLSRVQICCWEVDYVNDLIEIFNPEKTGKIVVKKTEIPTNKFYNLLKPIEKFKVSAEEAIRIAMKKGAKGFPPDYERVGGPGVVRLYNGKYYNLEGTFWKIPYKIGIRPILVDSKSGELYAVNDKGEYSVNW